MVGKFSQRSKDTNMWKISRFILVVMGIVGAFVFVEVVLYVIGSMWPRSGQIPLDEGHNDASMYRIVALGESTTAQIGGPAWPELLEAELNKRAGKRLFRVYNYGVAGSNTSAIVSRLSREVLPLKSHLVITMMGINDTKYLAPPVVTKSTLGVITSAFAELRTVKFIAVLWRTLISRFDRQMLYEAINCSDDALGERAWREDYLPRYKAIISDLYPQVYKGQFVNEQGDKKAEALLLQFTNLYPFSYEGTEMLIDHYAVRSDWESVLNVSKHVLNREPYIRLCIIQNDTIDSDTKKRMMVHLAAIIELMKSLNNAAQIIIDKKITNPIQFYHQIREELNTPYDDSSINTERAYNALASTLVNQGIAHVAMQYPLLPVDDLKFLLRGQEKTVFVSNEKNFQNALKIYAYEDLFLDNFAGVFGHTTQLGSQLIAQQAANTVLELLHDGE